MAKKSGAEPSHRSNLPGSVATAAGVALAYYATARLGLLFQLPGTNASPVWPPSGFGFAAMLLFGLRAWPGIAVGAFLANLLTLPHTHAGFAAAVAIGVGNTLEQIVAFILIRLLVPSLNPFDRAADVFRFLVVAAVSCAVASTNGAASLWLTGIIPAEAFRPVLFTWWLGDTAGMLVLAPMIFCWWRAPRLALSAPRALELCALVVTTVFADEFIFGGWIRGEMATTMKYLTLPCLLWAAFRFGPRETSTLAVFISVFAIAHTWGIMNES